MNKIEVKRRRMLLNTELDFHHMIKIAAAKKHTTMNAYIIEALQEKFDREEQAK